MEGEEVRYLYSLVRFVPNPANGECINIGAIVGSDVAGDWAVRHVSNDRRARAIGPVASLGSLYVFLAEIGAEVDRHNWAAESLFGSGSLLTEAWLTDLAHRHRNIVQLTRPAPIVADSAEEALDCIFEQMIVEPITSRRPYVTRQHVISLLADSYQKAGIGQHALERRPSLSAGNLTTPVDFAIVGSNAIQLAQTWSFQVAGIQEVAKEVKAWGYTMGALRRNGGRIAGAARVVAVDAGVDIEVLYAPPTSDEQQNAFGEAEQVFADLKVLYRPLGAESELADQASKLLQTA